VEATAPILSVLLLRLPKLNQDDSSFMEIANGCLKFKAHRMKKGDIGVSITLFDVDCCQESHELSFWRQNSRRVVYVLQIYFCVFYRKHGPKLLILCGMRDQASSVSTGGLQMFQHFEIAPSKRVNLAVIVFSNLGSIRIRRTQPLEKRCLRRIK
jgi:hypothetical protein